MPGDSIGKMFKVCVWGESHGPSIGVVIEGCPPGFELDLDGIRKELNRRKPGSSAYVSSRLEQDQFKILSGLYRGETTGTPISILIPNQGFNKSSYDELENTYRPGHADYTYQAKYGIRDFYGGGRSSARLTAPVVAAGSIARQILHREYGVTILAYITQIGRIQSGIDGPGHRAQSNCNFSDESKEREILTLLEGLKASGNSIGGVVECMISNVPPGFGEPLFDKLDADLASAIVGLNAVKGFEIGNGFNAAELTGKENNDEFLVEQGETQTVTNRSGGVLGGISNGMPIVFRAAFKATPSISMAQSTVDNSGNKKEIVIVGDHDVCVAIRAVPVVEALAAIVLCDHFLRYRGQCGVK